MSDPHGTPVHDHDDYAAAEMEYWRQGFIPASLLYDDCAPQPPPAPTHRNRVATWFLVQ